MDPQAPSHTEASPPTGIFCRVPPWLTLLALAPILGELVSSHQTPLEFINPLNLLILSLPYGCGALLCRELLVQWKGGGLSLVLLGIAYGVYEEGVVVYSLFDPQWSELGALSRYGYHAGVNWTWAVMTVQFHAMISIGCSIALAHMIHADRRAEPWLGKRGMVVCAAGLLAWIPVMGAIMIFDMKRPFPPTLLYLLAWGTVLGLGYAAHRLASRPTSAIERSPARPLLFFCLGVINVTAVFVGISLTAEHGTPPLIVTMLLLTLLDLVSLVLLWRWSGFERGWDDRHRHALVAGLFSFFIFFSFAKDFEHWQGSSIVGVLTIIGLWRLGRAIRRRTVEA